MWESRGPGADLGRNDRPRDFQGPVGARLGNLQIQRDVDQASIGPALPFASWGALAIDSSRRFSRGLPGSFGAKHRR